MGGVVLGVNSAHAAACLAAEVTRQSATAGSPTQAQMDAIEVTFHRAVAASCRLNNGSNGIEASLSALKDHGLLA
jgi:hypothetical protein